MELPMRRLRSVLEVESIFSAFVDSYGKDFNFLGESHDIWEIDAVLSGRVGITSGAEVYECVAGDIILHPPGVFHTAWAIDDNGVQLLTLTFIAHGGSRYVPGGKFVLTPSEQRLVGLLAEVIETKVDKHRSVEASIRPEIEQTIKNYVETLCLALHLRRSETASPEREEKAALYAEVVGYMRDHVDDAISVNDICTACGIGRTALKELIRRYTGKGIMQYYNHFRLQRIIELMSEGDTLGHVAVQMNFSSQNYLSEFFKRQTGVPPTEYLK